jgi:phosphoglycerol transferase
VKPHALFLTPAVLLHVAFVCRAAGLRGILQACAAVLLAAAAVKFGISYLAAGKNGLTLVGPAYGAMAASSSGVQGQLWLAAENLRGHVMAIVVLFALPIAVLGTLVAPRAGGDVAQTSPRYIAVFAFLVFGSLVAVTVLFTLSVAGTSPYESVARLHMRYYNFAFPLFLILVAAQTQTAFGSRA